MEMRWAEKGENRRARKEPVGGIKAEVLGGLTELVFEKRG